MYVCVHATISVLHNFMNSTNYTQLLVCAQLLRLVLIVQSMAISGVYHPLTYPLPRPSKNGRYLQFSYQWPLIQLSY